MADFGDKLQARIAGLQGLVTNLAERDAAIKDASAGHAFAADFIAKELGYLGDEVASGAFAEELKRELAQATAAAVQGCPPEDITANAAAVLIQRRLSGAVQRLRANSAQLAQRRDELRGVASSKEEEISALMELLAEWGAEHREPVEQTAGA